MKQINLEKLVETVFQPHIPQEIKDVFMTLAHPYSGKSFSYKLHCTMKEELGSIDLELAKTLLTESKGEDFYTSFWDELYKHRPALALACTPEADDDEAAFQDFIDQYFSRDAKAFVAGYLASKNLDDDRD